MVLPVPNPPGIAAAPPLGNWEHGINHTLASNQWTVDWFSFSFTGRAVRIGHF